MHEFYILPEKYFSIFFGGGEAAPVSYAYARKVAKKSIQSAKLLLSLTYVSFSRSFFSSLASCPGFASGPQGV